MLAILALIVTPVLFDIIEKAQRGAFEDSAYGIVDAAKLYYAGFYLDGKVKEEMFDFPNDTKLKISGEKPKSGSVRLDEDGKVALAISNGKWCALKKNDEEKITIIDYSIDECVLPLGPTLASCFNVNESGDTIKGYTCEEKKVIIPKKINGVTITTIGASAFGRTDISHVTIPDSVVDIKNFAFYGNQLKNLVIPDSVVSIGEQAFANNFLQNVELSKGLKKIGRFAFGSNQLTNLVIPEGVTSIGPSVFVSNQLTSIVIPSSVTSIGLEAFNNNQLPDDSAFIYARNNDGTEDRTELVSYGGAKRSDVYIPQGVVTIDSGAFSSSHLTSVMIPDSVINIGSSAFAYNQLTSIVLPINLTSIKSSVFYNNKLTSVEIPNGVTIIENGAFAYNELASINIPSSVSNIALDAFRYNQSNMKVIVNKSSESISGFPWGASSVEWMG